MLYRPANSAAHSVCAGWSGNCGVVALKSLMIELFLKSCFEKQSAALEAVALQMSGTDACIKNMERSWYYGFY